jgi:hypothetical protein
VNPGPRARQIEKSALREAQRALTRDDRTHLTRGELLQLRVQTVQPWQRGLFLVIGAALLAVGGVLYARDHEWFPLLVLGVPGLGVMLLGALGRKKTLDAALEQLGSDLGELVIQGIIHALE